MKAPETSVLQEIRDELLDRILGVIYVVAGITLSISIVAQIRQQEPELAAFYVLVYACLIGVTNKRYVPQYLRVRVPLALLYLVALSEFYFFGTTAVSYVMIYSLVLFAAVLLGFRSAIAVLILVFLTVSVRYWYGALASMEANGTAFSDINYIGSWLSPVGAFMTCAAIALVAVSTMLRRLDETIGEKSHLIEKLEQENQIKLETQSKLKVQEDQYSSLFENASDSVFLLNNVNGEVLQLNSSARELLGLDESSQDSLNINTLFPDVADSVLGSVRQQKAFANIDNVHFEQEGSTPRVLEIGSIPVDSSTAFLIVRDVTERNSLEQQFLQSQKLDAVGRLAGGIAHDFNNSLHAIIGLSELIQLDTREPTTRDRMERILKAGNRTQKMIGQLLAFSRQQVLEVEPLNLEIAIEESLFLIRNVLGAHITLNFETAETAVHVDADRTQLEQVIMNLCINARDAMGENGELNISLDKISIDSDFCAEKPWASEGEFAVIKVSDNGCGIEPSVLERVFEPFFTTKGLKEGSGLGLSTVLGIIDQHKGFINIVSELQQGTEVSVYLPLSKSVELQKNTDSKALESGKGTILLADDDSEVREVTAEMLSYGGYWVITAGSGKEALEHLQQKNQDIDMAVLDVVMPDTNGGVLLKSIRQEFPDLPVLFATGYSQEIVHNDFSVDEDINLIQKPFQREALLSKVQSLIEPTATY